MSAVARVVGAGFRAEVLHLSRSWAFLALIVLQALSFLLLVSMFALTGSRAPTALVEERPGPLAQGLACALAQCHHSFELRPMTAAAAHAALARGEVAAVLTIPAGFDGAQAHGQGAVIRLEVDNVNADMTEDLKRAVPSAIVSFGQRQHLGGIRLRVDEHDRLGHDTGFCDYMLVSALMLDAFLIASVLGALPIAREAEARTMLLLCAAPPHPLAPLCGRLLAAACVASLALAVPIGAVILGFGLAPLHACEAAADFALCIVVFTLLGAAAGAWVRGSVAVTGLLGTLALPMYLCSNSLEPQRFDGERIWLLAHGSPAYYAVGLLEHAFHGFMVTPEPLLGDAAVLLAWGMAATILFAWRLTRARAVG